MTRDRTDDAPRWTRVEAVFLEAVERPPGERAAFLDRACEGDRALRARVEALLRADADDAFLETPAARVDEAFPARQPDRRIGPYRLVRPIGAGGMGEVFLAVEEGEDFRRHVALKVVRAGVGPSFAERFSRERAILAQLDHPGIARFLDSGTTDENLPYYAMEFVDGERIDRYCDRRRLGLRERIALFRDVCLAVQHAHASLVVHRDLKPDNILVTADGVPKLLDFGIAKLLAEEEPDLTRTGSRVATPSYAAPEQLVGGRVGTASDVFSLGVLLYELLCGHRAFPPEQARVRAGASVGGQTPPPSVAAGTTSTRNDVGDEEVVTTPERASDLRGSTPQSLRRALRGDLDNIVMKAMREDPDERYLSAVALADDLDRYLAGEPVRARAPSFGYRASKFFHRNRAASIAAAVLALTLVAATISTRVQNRRIRTQAAQLETERDRALEVQSFLLESFGSAGGDDLAGDTLTVRQVLDSRADQVDALYAHDPETRAEMLHVLADGYERLNRLDDAERWATRAVEERRRLASGPSDPELARSLALLGWIHHERSRLDEAERLLRESLDIWRRIGTDSAGLSRTLNDLSGVLMNQGRMDEAEEVAVEAMEIRRATLPPDHQSIAITANNLANIVGSQGRRQESHELLEESARILEAALGPRHRRTLFARRNLSVSYAWLGDWERAADLGAELAAAFEELAGPNDIDLAWTLLSWGIALARTDRPEMADSVFRVGHRIAASQLGDNDLTATFHTRRAGLYGAQGRPAEALEQARAAVAMYRRLFDDHPYLADALRLQGSLALEREEQTASYREAAEMLTRLEGEEGAGAVRLTLSWARSLLAAGRHAEALPLFDTLARTVPIAYGDDHGYAPAPYLGRAEALVGLGERVSADAALAEARRRIVGEADVASNQEWLARVEALLDPEPPD